MEADLRAKSAYIVVFSVVHNAIVEVNARFSKSISARGSRDIAKLINIAVGQLHKRAVIERTCRAIDSVDRVCKLKPRRHYIVSKVYLDYLLPIVNHRPSVAVINEDNITAENIGVVICSRVQEGHISDGMCGSCASV